MRIPKNNIWGSHGRIRHLLIRYIFLDLTDAIGSNIVFVCCCFDHHENLRYHITIKCYYSSISVCITPGQLMKTRRCRSTAFPFHAVPYHLMTSYSRIQIKYSKSRGNAGSIFDVLVMEYRSRILSLNNYVL